MANEHCANPPIMTQPPPPFSRSLARILFRIAVILALAYGAHLLMDWVLTRLMDLPHGMQSVMLTSVLLLVLVAYALLIAIPYVPGVEIGLSLLLLQGPPIAPLVYLASVAGLMIAYFAGRLLPPEWIGRTLLDLRLVRAAALIDQIGALPPQDRLSLLSDRLPRRIGPQLVRWRYLMLAVLINLPGTMVIGGGGGICMIAGLSRLFAPAATVFTFFMAVLPVPFGIWFFGIGLLP